MKNLVLKGGDHIALVDDADYLRLSGFKWHSVPVLGAESVPVHSLTVKVYAARTVEGRTRLLHREVMGASEFQRVGFVNGNTLDCRRANLRFVGGKFARVSSLREIYRDRETGLFAFKVREGGAFVIRGTGYPTPEDATVARADYHESAAGSQQVAVANLEFLLERAYRRRDEADGELSASPSRQTRHRAASAARRVHDLEDRLDRLQGNYLLTSFNPPAVKAEPLTLPTLPTSQKLPSSESRKQTTIDEALKEIGL